MLQEECAKGERCLIRVQAILDAVLVDVNKKDRNGRSALSFAAGYGYLDVVRLLSNAKDIDKEAKTMEDGHLCHMQHHTQI